MKDQIDQLIKSLEFVLEIKELVIYVPKNDVIVLVGTSKISDSFVFLVPDILSDRVIPLSSLQESFDMGDLVLLGEL